MLFSKVTIEAILPTGDRRQFWFIFGSDHASIAEIQAELGSAGGVAGWRVDSVREDDGRRETSRYPTMIGRHGLVQVQPISWPLTLASGEVIPSGTVAQ